MYIYKNVDSNIKLSYLILINMTLMAESPAIRVLMIQNSDGLWVGVLNY